MYLKNYINLKNKNILIAGGMGYLGRSFIEPLLELGSFIIICDKLPISKFNEYIMKIDNKYKTKIIYFKCDLSSNKKRKQFVIRFKKVISNLDVFINCASLVGTSNLNGWNTSFKKQSSKLWTKVMETNLISIFDLIQNLQDLLQKNKGGSIINISSIYASIAPDKELYKGTKIFNPAAYSASKAGLNNLTKWLASTLAPKIRVNSISPGGIQRLQPKDFVKKYEIKTPLKRMAKENDVIGSVVFLSTDMSKYITGQDIVVDGGFTIK